MAGSRYTAVPANRWPYLSAALRGLDADLTALEEGGVGGGGGSVTQRESTALGVAARSGLQLHFGMYENSLTLAGLEQIEAWSGVLFDLKSITAEGASGWGNEWSGLQGSGWAINQYAAHPARLVYSIPLIPASVDDDIVTAETYAERAALQAPIYAAIAAGTHDAVWDQRGDDIAALEPNAIVVLGQECNMWKYHGSAMSVEAVEAGFKAAWRRAAQRIKAKAPDCVIAQVIGSNNAVAGYADGPAMARGLCVDWDDTLGEPVAAEDRVVDLYGGNVYNNYDRRASTLAELDAALAASHTLGAQHWYDLAVLLDRDFGVPEWGTTDDGDNAGADDPTWIGLFMDWMRARDRCVMHSYWNNTGTADWTTDLVSQFPASGDTLRRELYRTAAGVLLPQVATVGVICDSAQATTTLVGTRRIPWSAPTWDSGGYYDAEFGETFTVRYSAMYSLGLQVGLNTVGAAGNSALAVKMFRNSVETTLADLPLPNNTGDWTVHIWSTPYRFLAGDEVVVDLWTEVGDLTISRCAFRLASMGVISP